MRKSVLFLFVCIEYWGIEYWTLSHGASGKLPLATDDSCSISFFLSKISFAHSKQKTVQTTAKIHSKRCVQFVAAIDYYFNLICNK